MAGHEVDLVRRRELGRDDDVALVLAVLGVDQDVGPAVAGILQDVLDRADRAVVHVGWPVGITPSPATARGIAPACRSRD